MKIAIDGLFESWCSITLDFEKLHDYLDQLGPVLDTIPDGPEKSRASILMKVAEVQIRDCHLQSIVTSAALARALVMTTGSSGSRWSVESECPFEVPVALDGSPRPPGSRGQAF
jgi:hypothetical protein